MHRETIFYRVKSIAMNRRQLKDRFNILSEIIKKGNGIGVIQSTSPEIFQEQNDIAVKLMKNSSVH